jgi:hypothetical protein
MLPRLSGLARSKMQSVFGRGSREDSTGLHRWVLLKNSIVQSTPSLVDAPLPATVVVVVDEHEVEEHEEDVFTFPLLDDDAPQGGASESEWLDSLLETLEDDEEDEIGDDGASLAPSVASEVVYTPYSSPASSSENLIAAAHPLYYVPPVIAAPYPIPPYPPLLKTTAGIYADELDDMPVPDAIEDTSDDESEAPATPSSAGSSLVSLVEHHRRTQRHAAPRIVVDSDDDAFLSFDPLPFAEEPHNPPGLYVPYEYQEC